MRTGTLQRFASAALIVGWVGGILWSERRRPLRRQVDPGARRILRNVAVGVVTAAEVAIAERPLIEALARSVERHRLGLLPMLGMPRWVETALAVPLLDYTLYLWHILLHRVPVLWRFHLAHHTDLDLDASSALRFHFGEFAASIPWRAAQVALIGVSPRALALWRMLTAIEVVFHHSNFRLPRRIEEPLTWLVMTPRLHGIHHSIVDEERDSNFSSGLTLWDRLHGTLRTDVPRDTITIGVLPYRAPHQVTLAKTLRVPFVSERRRRMPPP